MRKLVLFVVVIVLSSGCYLIDKPTNLEKAHQAAKDEVDKAYNTAAYVLVMRRVSKSCSK